MQEVFENIIDRLDRASDHYECEEQGREDVYMVDLEEAIEIVKEVATECNNRWIPCEVELPLNKVSVLVTYSNGDIAVDFIQDDGDWFWEDREEGLEVIAWQPLPEPYKPKED